MFRSLLSLALGKRRPRVGGTLRLPGLRATTTIRQDAHGITYVDASTDDDAFFAMGFCQARDRGFQMELYLRVARGTLAEVLGAEMLLILTRFGGQSDYAARAATCIFNSNSIGLT